MPVTERTQLGAAGAGWNGRDRCRFTWRGRCWWKPACAARYGLYSIMYSMP